MSQQVEVIVSRGSNTYLTLDMILTGTHREILEAHQAMNQAVQKVDESHKTIGDDRLLVLS